MHVCIVQRKGVVVGKGGGGGGGAGVVLIVVVLAMILKGDEVHTHIH